MDVLSELIVGKKPHLKLYRVFDIHTKQYLKPDRVSLTGSGQLFIYEDQSVGPDKFYEVDMTENRYQIEIASPYTDKFRNVIYENDIVINGDEREWGSPNYRIWKCVYQLENQRWEFENENYDTVPAYNPRWCLEDPQKDLTVVGTTSLYDLCTFEINFTNFNEFYNQRKALI